MSVVLFSRWQCVLLHLLGGSVCRCVFKEAMCVVASFRRQYVLLVSFRWQCVLLYVVDGNVCCWAF